MISAERGDRRRHRPRRAAARTRSRRELASTFKDDADPGLLGEAQRPRRQQRGAADGRLERPRHAGRGQPARGRRPVAGAGPRGARRREVAYDTFWITQRDPRPTAATADLARELSAIPAVESIFPQVTARPGRAVPGRRRAQGRRGRVGHRRHQRRRRVGPVRRHRRGHRGREHRHRRRLRPPGPGRTSTAATSAAATSTTTTTGSTSSARRSSRADGDIHGTHTMGTIAGGDGGANQIGVAPGAKWIASNAISQGRLHAVPRGAWSGCSSRSTSRARTRTRRSGPTSSATRGASPASRPTRSATTSSRRWIDSGIFGTWSNRNLGPGCDTTGSPGGRALSYSNGAYDINHVIASFSSRGPGQDGMIKPNISGPGVNVRSSIPGGGYTALSGTSMSTPHLAGAVALLWSAAPALIGDIEGTREHARRDARSTQPDLTCGGTAEDNNVFGEGRLDVLAAADAAPIGDTGTVERHGHRRRTSGDPIAGADGRVHRRRADRETTTDADGDYHLTLVAGTYDVDGDGVRLRGRRPATSSVEDGETVTLDFALAPRRVVQPDRAGARPGDRRAAARRERRPIEGTPLTRHDQRDRAATASRTCRPARTTSPRTATGCFLPRTKEAVIDGDLAAADAEFHGDERKRFRLGPNVDAAGYTLPDRGGRLRRGHHARWRSPVTRRWRRSPCRSTSRSTGSRTTPPSSRRTGTSASSPDADTAYSNPAIPSAAPPNAVVAAFWDDLVLDAASSVADRRRQRDASRSSTATCSSTRPADRVDFEITLYDDGQILIDLPQPRPGIAREPGSSATVGIENATGTIGLQYSLNDAVLSERRRRSASSRRRT